MSTTIRQDTRVYEGARFDVHSVQLPGREGRTVQRDAVAAAAAVVILPLIDEHTVVMIRNDRFAVGETLWELPAGTIETGEDPSRCARRELIEESGYRCEKLDKLIDFYPSPGICTERMHAYVAKHLTHVGQDLDENERITVEVVALERVLEMIRDNTIRDAKTIATILYYVQFDGNK